jgi:hypothetical protein
LNWFVQLFTLIRTSTLRFAGRSFTAGAGACGGEPKGD